MRIRFTTGLLIVLIAQTSRAQLGGLYSKDITTNDGLSLNHVTCITKDNQGFMWFGTTSGLNRYDGNEFIVYYHNPKNPESITWNTINSILYDSKERLWIGTGGRGLNRFDKEKNLFREKHRHEKKIPFV